MEYTRTLTRWVESLKYENIPGECIAKAKEQLFNVIGAALLGVPSDAAQSVVTAMEEYGASGPSTVFGVKKGVPPQNAAIANAFTAQIFEFEDWVIYSHSGAAVVATAMAVAEAVGASGKEFLVAVVAGNELAGRTGLAISRGTHVGNSMPNHQVDTTVVAGRLLGLDAERLDRAVGLSCFMAMEPCPVGFLTDAKGLINSFPAHVGIATAYMSKHGVAGNLGMIEHPAGYLASVSEFVDFEELTDGLGERWILPTLHSKPYPICGYHISVIEATLRLKHAHGLSGREIERVDVYAPGVTLYAGNRYHSLEPDLFDRIANGTATHVPLLFDVPYPVAAALIDGELTPRQYDRVHLMDPEIQALARKVKLHVDPELHAAYYKWRYGARVVVTTTDGRSLEEGVEDMPGAPGHPFDVEEKFLKGARPLLGETKAERSVQLIQCLEQVEDMRELGLALRPGNV